MGKNNGVVPKGGTEESISQSDQSLSPTKNNNPNQF